VAVVLLTLVVAAGCSADAQRGSPAGTAPSRPATAAPLPTGAAPTPGRSKGATEPPSDDFPARTLTGTVRITGSCIELVTGAGLWTLVGPGVADLRAGERVEVHGNPAPQLELPCAGGAFAVARISR